MKRSLSERKARLLAWGLTLSGALALTPLVLAKAQGDLGASKPEGAKTVALPSTRGEPIGADARVILAGAEVFRFAGDDGTLAVQVAERLRELQAQGALRSDRIMPGRQDDRYSLQVGAKVILEIDEAFARRQGARPGELTLQYVNVLRAHLGGVPIQEQASRGLIPGARSGIGMASWYGGRFHGRRSASGERFDQHAFTVAHKTLPFGTLLLVTNLSNGKTTLVRVTDRGPYAHGRTLDLSRAAAESLDMVRAGVVKVRYTILDRGSEI